MRKVLKSVYTHLNISHKTCYSSNKSPFNKEENDLNLESVANIVTIVTRLWLLLCDDRMIMLTDWQKAPLGYSALCSILAIALNNHEAPTWKSIKPR